MKFQTIEFEKDALLKIIEEAKEFCPDLDFSISDFYNDLLTSVPLFCRDGQYYKWVHKSLQEYFAAQFIFKDSKKSQDVILGKIYNSDYLDKYVNLLDLYYDIDNWGFKKNVLLPLCNSFVKFYSESYFTSEILHKDDVEKRIGHLFLREVCIMKSQEELIPFSQIEENTRHILSHGVNSMTRFHGENVYISNSYNPQRKLLSLLNKRQPNLFKEYRRSINSPQYSLPINNIIKIDMHTGDNNRNAYIYLNFYLGGGLRDFQYYLDYNACKNEIDSINDIMKKKEEVSSLVDGL